MRDDLPLLWPTFRDEPKALSKCSSAATFIEEVLRWRRAYRPFGRRLGVTAGAATLIAVQGNLEGTPPTLFRLDTERPQPPELIGEIAENDPVGTLASGGALLYAFVTADSAVLILRNDAVVVDKVTLDTPLSSHPRGADIAPDGQLFGVFGERGQPQTFELRTINSTTGATQLVGPITGDPVTVIEAIAFANDGTLYAVGSPSRETGSDFLYTINPATGATTRISGPLGVVDIDVLAFAEGFLYGADSNDTVASDLYRIDPQTGALDIIGNTGIRSLTGIAAETAILVPVDIKPRSCPNEIDTSRPGRFITAAILGTSDLDTTKINPASVRLAGVSPCRWMARDVATPFEPFIGKIEPTDCHTLGRDRQQDLVLHFPGEVVADVLRGFANGEAVSLELTGRLKDEFGGDPLVGEDVVVVTRHP